MLGSASMRASKNERNAEAGLSGGVDGGFFGERRQGCQLVCRERQGSIQRPTLGRSTRTPVDRTRTQAPAGRGVTRKVILGYQGDLNGIFVPLGWALCRSHPRRGRRPADVLQDGPHVHRLGDEGDDPPLGPAFWADQKERFVDAGQQHDPKIRRERIFAPAPVRGASLRAGMRKGSGLGNACWLAADRPPQPRRRVGASALSLPAPVPGQ
jgi:hypothetical protein